MENEGPSKKMENEASIIAIWGIELDLGHCG
jgi:hypothetical protein